MPNVTVTLVVPVVGWQEVDAVQKAAALAFPGVTPGVDISRLPVDAAGIAALAAAQAQALQQAQAQEQVKAEQAAIQIAQDLKNKQDQIDFAVNAARVEEQAKADQRVGESIDLMTQTGLAACDSARQEMADKTLQALVAAGLVTDAEKAVTEIATATGKTPVLGG